MIPSTCASNLSTKYRILFPPDITSSFKNFALISSFAYLYFILYLFILTLSLPFRFSHSHPPCSLPIFTFFPSVALLKRLFRLRAMKKRKWTLTSLEFRSINGLKFYKIFCVVHSCSDNHQTNGATESLVPFEWCYQVAAKIRRAIYFLYSITQC